MISSSKHLRISATEEENILWDHLRSKKLLGLKFRRQHSLGKYIVDFVCLEKKLIIELDGQTHIKSTKYDSVRDNWLKSEGYKVLRFWNREVLTNLNDVLTRIIQESNHPPLPLPSREG